MFSVDFLSVTSLGVDSNSPSINDNAVDSAGNHYVAGHIKGTVDFDPTNVLAGDADLLTARGEAMVLSQSMDPTTSFCGCVAWGEVQYGIKLRRAETNSTMQFRLRSIALGVLLLGIL